MKLYSFIIQTAIGLNDNLEELQDQIFQLSQKLNSVAQEANPEEYNYEEGLKINLNLLYNH